MIDAPVLVVGGGPVGLTLAIALSRQGVRSVVVNDRKTTTMHPKLDVVNCRSMEIFRQLGFAENVRAAGNPLDANQYCAIAASASGPFYSVMSDRHLIYLPVARAKEKIRACEDGSLPLESMQRIAQMRLEPVLLAEAQADPNIDVRFGWSLYGFEQDETGVTALAHNVDSGAGQTIRAQYLVGCDGPNSRVRNFLNIDYDGTRDVIGELFIIHLRSDDIADLYPNRQPYWHTWIGKPGFNALLVSPDASRNDYVLHRPFAPRAGQSVESVVETALGRKLRFEIVQSGPWRPQFLVAESLGRKRVFIAGDATHQFMPTGGLGMNTGVAEAHNLAWKLAACLRGWGGPRLLASYEDERLPVARRNREHVKKCAAAAFEAQFPAADKPIAEAMAAGLEGGISRMYESLGIEIGYRYRGSPIVCPDASPEPACEERRYLPTTWPGARLPSASHADGQAIYDQLDPRGFTLLTMSDDAEDAAALEGAAAARGVPLKRVQIGEPWIRKLYERRYVLVRPDQHVCWRGDAIPGDCAAIVDAVRGAADHA